MLRISPGIFKALSCPLWVPGEVPQSSPSARSGVSVPNPRSLTYPALQAPVALEWARRKGGGLWARASDPAGGRGEAHVRLFASGISA